MNVLQSCDVPSPFNHSFPWDTGVPQMNTNAFSIVCRKTPSDTVVVAGTTSAGNIDPVVVQAVPAPGPNIADRVSALEAGLAAAVPKGAILTWFSMNGTIPPGWSVCDGTRGPNLKGFFLRGGSSVTDLTDEKKGSNSHFHSVPALTTTTFNGAHNNDVKQEGGSPLSVPGVDHTHTIQAFNTNPQDNVPEYKAVLFLCR